MSDADKKILLHSGRYANANVWRIVGNGGDMVVKDYSQSPWLIKNTFGRWMIKHEVKVLKSLSDTGFVPERVKRISAFVFEEEFCPGETLRYHSTNRNSIDDAFFYDLEKAVTLIHSYGYVHLDLRNARNIIVTPEGKPVLLDWQSAVCTKYFPKFLRRLAENIDINGVYKHWNNSNPATLTATQRKSMKRFSKIRRLWFLRGYMFTKRRSSPDAENRG